MDREVFSRKKTIVRSYAFKFEKTQKLRAIVKIKSNLNEPN